jgi:hypothetical protein
LHSEVEVKNKAKETIKDEKTLSESLNGTLSKKDEIKLKNYNSLKYISENYPKILYSKWSFLADLFVSERARLVAK